MENLELKLRLKKNGGDDKLTITLFLTPDAKEGATSLTCPSVCDFTAPEWINLVYFVLKVNYLRVFLDMFDENRLSH